MGLASRAASERAGGAAVPAGGPQVDRLPGQEDPRGRGRGVHTAGEVVDRLVAMGSEVCP